MNAQFLTHMADAAKRDGLTLTWSLIRLAEKLELDQQSWLEGQRQRTPEGSTSQNDVRLDNEALALVLMTAIQASAPGDLGR